MEPAKYRSRMTENAVDYLDLHCPTCGGQLYNGFKIKFGSENSEKTGKMFPALSPEGGFETRVMRRSYSANAPPGSGLVDLPAPHIHSRGEVQKSSNRMSQLFGGILHKKKKKESSDEIQADREKEYVPEWLQNVLEEVQTRDVFAPHQNLYSKVERTLRENSFLSLETEPKKMCVKQLLFAFGTDYPQFVQFVLETVSGEQGEHTSKEVFFREDSLEPYLYTPLMSSCFPSFAASGGPLNAFYTIITASKLTLPRRRDEWDTGIQNEIFDVTKKLFNSTKQFCSRYTNQSIRDVHSALYKKYLFLEDTADGESAKIKVVSNFFLYFVNMSILSLSTNIPVNQMPFRNELLKIVQSIANQSTEKMASNLSTLIGLVHGMKTEVLEFAEILIGREDKSIVAMEESAE